MKILNKFPLISKCSVATFWPRVGPIYLADTDTKILVSVNCISILAISVSVFVSATLDIGYIGVGQISVKIPGNQHLSARIPGIGQNENNGIGIGGQYVGSSISVLAKISAGTMYRYRYQLDPYRSNPMVTQGLMF